MAEKGEGPPEMKGGNTENTSARKEDLPEEIADQSRRYGRFGSNVIVFSKLHRLDA